MHELIVVDYHLQSIISSGGDQDEIVEAAHAKDYRRMWWDGLEKVQNGATTLKELATAVQVDT